MTGGPVRKLQFIPLLTSARHTSAKQSQMFTIVIGIKGLTIVKMPAIFCRRHTPADIEKMD
jgi:hypothetical protein